MGPVLTILLYLIPPVRTFEEKNYLVYRSYNENPEGLAQLPFSERAGIKPGNFNPIYSFFNQHSNQWLSGPLILRLHFHLHVSFIKFQFKKEVEKVFFCRVN